MVAAVSAVSPPPCRLTADEPDGGIVDEVVERADGIGAAADTGNDGIRQLPFLFQQLLFDLFGDHRLKIPHHGREGMRPHYGTDAVVGIGNTVGPFPEGGGAGVLQRTGAAGDRHYLRAQQPHPINVQCLPLGILLPHENHALHAHEGGGGGGGHAMLSCAGFGDEAGLAHPLGQQCLPQYVVDLVSAGVVEILPLEIDLCAAEIRRDLACIVQAAGAACVIVQQGGRSA